MLRSDHGEFDGGRNAGVFGGLGDFGLKLLEFGLGALFVGELLELALLVELELTSLSYSAALAEVMR